MSLFTARDCDVIAKQLGAAGFKSPAYERIIDAVADMLAKDDPGGFDPVTFRETADAARRPKR